MLEINDMTCGYGQITALRNVTLSVKAGQLVALIGANGAGKSTTLRAISGLVPPRSGTMTFEGEDITSASPQKVLTKGIAHCPGASARRTGRFPDPAGCRAYRRRSGGRLGPISLCGGVGAG